ncbi:MauE/DoxX family redox-associated membrane protein [Streptomyces sp. enrichment culture]|uniref:MauE/DoxX family redox-associated membrane protein n=1 Tax=Streptomyces sp. enrichment culture TaxID=1795815 RepID=UPI003F55FDDF
MNHLIDTGRIFLGLVFLCSVVGKIRGAAAYTGFRVAMARLVPALRGRTGPVAVLVVGAETAVVGALAVPATVTAGFALAAVLLAAFTTVLASALRRDETVACHCFGGGGQPVALRHVLRNVGLLCVASAGLVARLMTTGDTAAASRPAVFLFTAGAGVFLALVTVALDELAYLLSRPEAKSTGRARG